MLAGSVHFPVARLPFPTRQPGTDHPSAPAVNSQKIKPNNISDEYELLEVIGRGSFSVCRRCLHRSTRTEYAVKVSPPPRASL